MRYLKIKSLVTAAVLLLALPAHAGYQLYSPELDAVSWRSSGNRLECRLSQSIPGYGKALFRHQAMRPVEFLVAINHVPRKANQAMVYVNPPEWKRYAKRKILGRVPINLDETIITLPADWAQRVADELHEGMEAAWSHADWVDGRDLITAKVLPIRFAKAWQDFRDCETNLIRYSYDDVRSNVFYFDKGNLKLSAKERKSLDKLAEYAMLDPEFDYIQIRSSTDSRGLRKNNLSISKKRAATIKNYLVEKGIDAKRFRIIAQGEKNPKYNNRTASGRAKNRRIEITLVK